MFSSITQKLLISLSLLYLSFKRTQTISFNHLHSICFHSIFFTHIINMKHKTKITVKKGSIEVKKESLLRIFYQYNDTEGVCLFTFLSLTFFILLLSFLVYLSVCLSIYTYFSLFLFLFVFIRLLHSNFRQFLKKFQQKYPVISYVFFLNNVE